MNGLVGRMVDEWFSFGWVDGWINGLVGDWMDG